MTYPVLVSGQGGPLGTIDSRRQEVVDAFGQLADGVLGFEGLRRSLGWHPQTLTRVLRRMEADGEIQREDSGYRLLTGRSTRTGAEAWKPVFVAALPAHIDRRVLVEAFKNRWFNDLRWVGLTDQPEGFQLRWSLASGNGQVRLRVSPQFLGLEVASGDSADATVLASTASMLRALSFFYRDESRRRTLPGPHPALPRPAA